MEVLTNTQFFPSIWVQVASVDSDDVAAYVAFIKVHEKKDEQFSYQAAGVIYLERFQGTQLVRFIIKQEGGSILTCLNFAVDSKFEVNTRKVQGKRSGIIGIKVAIVFEAGFVEGYEKLVPRMPFDGINGSAMMMGKACEHAARVVVRGINHLQQLEAAHAAATTSSGTVPTRPSARGALAPPGSGASSVFSPMSIG